MELLNEYSIFLISGCLHTRTEKNLNSSGPGRDFNSGILGNQNSVFVPIRESHRKSVIRSRRIFKRNPNLFWILNSVQRKSNGNCKAKEVAFKDPLWTVISRCPVGKMIPSWDLQIFLELIGDDCYHVVESITKSREILESRGHVSLEKLTKTFEN